MRVVSLKQRHGMTLIEVFVSILWIVTAGYALLHAMEVSQATMHYLGEVQVATYAAKGELEQLAATSIDTLWAASGAPPAPRPIPGLPGGVLIVQIRSADIRQPLNPNLLDVHVAACWDSYGRRIGEDLNGDGILSPAEDANANTWVDSPVMISTRVAR